MSWKKNFGEGKEIILSTCSKVCIPNANIVLSLGFIYGKLLVANCQMSMTINNLTENNNICVIGGYYRIKGKVNIRETHKRLSDFFRLSQEQFITVVSDELKENSQNVFFVNKQYIIWAGPED